MLKFKSGLYTLSVMIMSLLLFLSGNATAFSQALTIMANVQPTNTVVGEKVIYTISITSQGAINNLNPQLPTISAQMGFSSFSFVGTQTQTTIINGSVKNTVNYNYVFVPSKEGTFTIPPSSVTWDKAVYNSAPVTLTVTAAPSISASGTPPLNQLKQSNIQNQASQSSHSTEIPKELEGRVVPPIIRDSPELQKALTGAIFILPVYDSLTIYQGEQVPVAFHLLIDDNAFSNLRIDIGRLEIGQIREPNCAQFLKDEMFSIPKALRFEERRFGNRTYKVSPLYQVALTPTKTGELTVEQFKVQMFLSTTSSRMSNDPFSIFDDFFAGRSAHAIEMLVQSPELKFSVQPLPTDGRTNDFCGAVGNFSVSAKVDNITAKANDDILNYQITITGDGDASAITPPEFKDTPYLHLLEPPRNTVNKTMAENKRISSNTFDYLLRPTMPGKTEIPGATMQIFNPKQRKYETLNVAPIAVDISTGTQSLNNTPMTSPSMDLATNLQSVNNSKSTNNQDIAYIHIGPITAIKTKSRFPILFFIASILFTTLCVISAFLVRNKMNKSASDVIESMSRKAKATAKKSFRSVVKSLRADNEKFYTQLSTALRNYFADKFKTDRLGLTSEEIEVFLSQSKEIPFEKLEELRDFLDNLEMSKYSSKANTSPEIRRSQIETAKEYIKLTERHF